MKLKNFKIENFKSIIDSGKCHLSDLNNVTIMAGQNESGKTSILEAIDFFTNGAGEKFVTHQKRHGTKETKVVCNFLLGDWDKNELKTNLVKENLKGLDGFIDSIKEVALSRSYKNNSLGEIVLDESDVFIEKVISIIKEKVLVKNEAGEITEEKIQELSTTEANLFVTNFLVEIRKLLPVVSLYNSFVDFLPSEILITALDSNKAVKDFQEVFDIDLAKIASITDPREREIEIKAAENRATDDFNESWSQSISTIKGDKKYKFKIQINDAIPKKVIFMIEGQDNIPLYIEQKSLGFRWFSAFHLRLRALRKETAGYEYGNNDENILILIDEPGQNLHEIAQDDAKKVILETIEKGIQIIYTTHNPNLLTTLDKEVDLSRIRLVSNSPEEGTKIYTISQYSARSGSLDALSPIRTALGLKAVESSFIGDHKKNVVVEGITDHYYLYAFKMLLDISEPYFFLPSCGVDNVRSIIGVLIGWGHKYKAVLDDDKKQGRKVYNDLKRYFFESNDENAHKFIYKINGCDGIEDVFSQADLAKLVLERELTEEEKSKKNSEIVKPFSKEIFAKKFYIKVNKKEITIDSLDKETKENIQKIFTWLASTFIETYEQ
jgi:predicted ATP-dependent endonuclease of OLD family